MDQKRLRVGLIGFGLSGRYFHFPYLKANEKFQLDLVYTRQSKPDFLQQQNIPVTHNLNELIEHSELDLIIITSPNHFHYEQIKACLENKKHVLVEKPMVARKEQVTELFEMAKSNGMTLNVFQNRRYDRDFIYLKSLITEKHILFNEVTEFESHFDRLKDVSKSYSANNWRDDKSLAGAGILFDLGSHLIDQTLHLFGLPQSVFAKLKHQKDAQVDNYFSVQFDYGHFIAHLRAGQFINFYSKRFKLSSLKMGVFKEGLDRQEGLLRKGLEPNSIEFAQELRKEKIKLRPINNDSKDCDLDEGGYELFYESLYNCIVEGANIIPEQEVYNTLRLIELCFESNQTKKEITL